MGEQEFVFSENQLHVTSPAGKVLEYDVSTVQGDTFILTDKAGSAFNYANSLVGNLKYTLAMGVSTALSNSSYPISFADSIARNDTLTFTLFQCLPWAQKGTCNFSPPGGLKALPEPEHKIKAVIPQAETCGKCDEATHQCTTCDCKTGGDCKPTAECEKACGTNAKYSCSWTKTPP